MIILYGVPASLGVGIGNVYFIEAACFNVTLNEIEPDRVHEEHQRFQLALEKAKEKTALAREKTNLLDNKEIKEIWNAHSLFFDDPFIQEKIEDLITQQCMNAEYAVHKVFQDQSKQFAALNNERFVLDLKDIENRILSELTTLSTVRLSDLPSNAVIVAKELYPSQTAELFSHKVAGIITEVGGTTSHTAIIARSLEIPAVVGLEGIMSQLSAGQKVVVDGFDGTIIINPSVPVQKKYHSKMVEFQEKEQSLIHCALGTSQTSDGKYVQISANMELPAEVNQVQKYCAEGVGLFRTEFLFVQQDFHNHIGEDKQYEIYKSVLQKICDNPHAKKSDQQYVIFRTIDIGGDKFFEKDNISKYKEPNPFLGKRAVRLCLSSEGMEFFKTQMKALIRASMHGDLRIMFPFITTVEEIIEIKKIYADCQEELRQRNIPFREDIPLGTMVEIPSAALIVDILIDEVDFFSIGTNDLIQYTMAVDRNNEQVNYMYDPINMAVLRLIRDTVKAAKSKGKWVGVCGDMASYPSLAAILVGLGVDELSVPAMYIPIIKETIRSVAYQKLSSIVYSKIMKSRTNKDIREKVKKHIIPLLPKIVVEEFLSEWEKKL